jgi:hypothetical protein
MLRDGVETSPIGIAGDFQEKNGPPAGTFWRGIQYSFLRRLEKKRAAISLVSVQSLLFRSYMRTILLLRHN